MLPDLAQEAYIPATPETATAGDRIGVMVSTTFFDGANLSTEAQDLVLISKDSVYFYVSSKMILQASNNRFQNMIPFTTLRDKPDIVLMGESSAAFSLMIHTIYGIFCPHHIPFDILVAAVRLFPLYGLVADKFIVPPMPLYHVILSQAPLYPIQVYALAASLDLFDLASACSSHLLSCSFSNLTDEQALEMGPMYLKRLFVLLSHRQDILKRMLLPPPRPHPEADSCTFLQQRTVATAWTIAAVSLAWEVQPDTPNDVIQTILGSASMN